MQSLKNKFQTPAPHNWLARKMLRKAVIVPLAYARFSPCGGGTSNVSIANRILAKWNLYPAFTVFKVSEDTIQGQVI
jgi:hypothetical protein